MLSPECFFRSLRSKKFLVIDSAADRLFTVSGLPAIIAWCRMTPQVFGPMRVRCNRILCDGPRLHSSALRLS